MSTLVKEYLALDDSDILSITVPLQVMGLSAVYAAALGWIERRYPIKPDHTWAEVAGGVVISLLPIALEARRRPTIDWRTYENIVWRCFMASGMPIILWQLGEALIRQVELINYAAERPTRSSSDHADPTPPLAVGSRERTGWSAPGSERSDSAAAEGSGDA